MYIFRGQDFQSDVTAQRRERFFIVDSELLSVTHLDHADTEDA